MRISLRDVDYDREWAELKVGKDFQVNLLLKSNMPSNSDSNCR